MSKNTIDEINIAELLCTKLCHDLAGPVTGLCNGTELLEENQQEMLESAIKLISSSSKEAMNRLKMLRLAYGSAVDGDMENKEFMEVVSSYFSGSKISIEWVAGSKDVGLLDRKKAKLLANLTLTVSSLLAFGGIMKITCGSEDFSFNAHAERMKNDEIFESLFIKNSSPETIDTKNIGVFYSWKLAKNMSVTFDNKKEGNLILLSGRFQ